MQGEDLWNHIELVLRIPFLRFPSSAIPDKACICVVYALARNVHELGLTSAQMDLTDF